MLLLVGAKRSGKGTIARVLTRLVGPANVCGPTTSSLAGPFGLQPLLGKSLAIVSDARFNGDHMPIVVERLLCISGEDALTVDRKFLGSVTLKLPTRFAFLSNELPKLSESSGALAGRFLVLKFTQSFYGREDPFLTTKLLEELPGILKWAIEGWHRLRADGRFIEPASGRAAFEELEDLLSPVGAFVRERCVVGPQYRCHLRDLHAAWARWCLENGRDHPGTVQSFGRDLAAAVPDAHTRRNHATGRFVEGVQLSPD
jgi:putative DNA primase/helicase